MAYIPPEVKTLRINLEHPDYTRLKPAEQASPEVSVIGGDCVTEGLLRIAGIAVFHVDIAARTLHVDFFKGIVFFIDERVLDLLPGGHLELRHLRSDFTDPAKRQKLDAGFAAHRADDF